MNAKQFGNDIEINTERALLELADVSEDIAWTEDGENYPISLSAEALEWATSVCEDIEDEDEQWQAFLRAMAIAGVEQWLSQSAFDLPVTYARDQAPSSGVNAQVGHYRLCVLPTGPAGDDRVMIPATTVLNSATDIESAIDTRSLQDTSPIAHLYCLVEVYEEYDQILVRSGLRQNQLQSYLAHYPSHNEAIHPMEGANERLSQEPREYAIPVAEFTVTPEQALLYVNTLEPETMVTSVQMIDGAESTVGQVVRAMAPEVEQRANTLSQTVTNALEKAEAGTINVGRWLSGQVDELAAQLGWQMIPALVPSQGFLPVRNELEAVMDQLERQGAVLPPQARGRMNDVEISGGQCRIYAWIWPLAESELEDPTIPEWSLFVLLGPAPDEPIPQTLELVIRDEQGDVVRSTGQDGGDYLYAQAIGSLDELFWVRLEASGGETVELPAFQCVLS
ncbi:MAG: DUF1822 family protein [Cyanobacteria bacterium P01_F01_bin.150]